MKFSVLLSVYFKEYPEALSQALCSIIEQTLLPSEVVLVKDGVLTEKLERVIQDFLISCPVPLKILALPTNVGLGAALRVGVENCSYDIIARMDTDDVARPNRFEKQINFLEGHPDIDVLGTNIEEFNQVPGDLGRFKFNEELHDNLIKKISLKSPFNHPTIMMRKAALEQAGNYNGDLPLFEDYALFLRMWKAGMKFHNLQEVLLDFRVGDGIQTIKRRSGLHYLKKENDFLKYAKRIDAYTSMNIIKYKLLKFPVRLLPPRIVLSIYNTFLRK